MVVKYDNAWKSNVFTLGIKFLLKDSLVKCEPNVEEILRLSKLAS